MAETSPETAAVCAVLMAVSNVVRNDPIGLARLMRVAALLAARHLHGAGCRRGCGGPRLRRQCLRILAPSLVRLLLLRCLLRVLEHAQGKTLVGLGLSQPV